MSKKMKKIGIMGGTFDPIHMGHLILGEKAYEQLGLDKVLFMPCGNPPHKRNRKGRATDEQRAKMVRLAIEDNPHFELSLIEMHEEGYTYTYRTLEQLNVENPDTEYYFIIGADSLYNFDTWREHLEALEKNGYIRKDATKPRAIEIIDDNFNLVRREVVNVPLVGTVAAGQPILAVENIDAYFPIPAEYMPNEQSFMLTVKGDSMINAGIFDGDQVLVKQQSTAENGDMVVALIDDSATVKTFYKENGYYRLQPENDNMEPIIITGNLKILGKVFGVFRFFS